MRRVVDLADYASPGVRVYAGRDRGEAARAHAKLQEADAAGDSVLVKIPDDVFSINSSFFMGMFGDSIRALQEEQFRRRYQFEGPGAELVVEDGIREVLRTSSPLPSGNALKAAR